MNIFLRSINRDEQLKKLCFREDPCRTLNTIFSISFRFLWGKAHDNNIVTQTNQKYNNTYSVLHTLYYHSLVVLFSYLVISYLSVISVDIYYLCQRHIIIIIYNRGHDILFIIFNILINLIVLCRDQINRPTVIRIGPVRCFCPFDAIRSFANDTSLVDAVQYPSGWDIEHGNLYRVVFLSSHDRVISTSAVFSTINRPRGTDILKTKLSPQV